MMEEIDRFQVPPVNPEIQLLVSATLTWMEKNTVYMSCC